MGRAKLVPRPGGARAVENADDVRLDHGLAQCVGHCRAVESLLSGRALHEGLGLGTGEQRLVGEGGGGEREEGGEQQTFHYSILSEWRHRRRSKGIQEWDSAPDTSRAVMSTIGITRS